MIDFLINDEYDFIFSDGDLSIGNSKNQSVELLLVSSQGEWKEFPEAGADIRKAQNGSINQFLERNIRVQLEADNFKIEKLIIKENSFELIGDYEKI